VAVPDAGSQVYLCALGDAAQRAAAGLAERLRDALPALRLVLNAGGGKLPAQLKRADKSGARLALILGDEETARQAVQVKLLERGALRQVSSGAPSQTECSWAELPARLAGLLQAD